MIMVISSFMLCQTVTHLCRSSRHSQLLCILFFCFVSWTLTSIRRPWCWTLNPHVSNNNKREKRNCQQWNLFSFWLLSEVLMNSKFYSWWSFNSLKINFSKYWFLFGNLQSLFMHSFSKRFIFFNFFHFMDFSSFYYSMSIIFIMFLRK